MAKTIGNGTFVDFTGLILDGLKLGETRGMNTHLPINRWVGIYKDGQVQGRVKFGNPITITNKSPEYADAWIEGTEYDLADGESKQYYPIIDKEAPHG